MYLVDFSELLFLQNLFLAVKVLPAAVLFLQYFYSVKYKLIIFVYVTSVLDFFFSFCWLIIKDEKSNVRTKITGSPFSSASLLTTLMIIILEITFRMWA